MKFKKLISLGLSLVMALSLAVPAMAEEAVEETVEPYVVSEDVKDSIVILHSNDVHGAIEGYAKMAALKAMFEEAGANVIVVDAGDYIQGETYVSVSQGETAVELMNMVGYTLSTLGNHEFDYGYENMKALAEKADFEILAANILFEGKPAFGTNKVVELGGKKVGFFGMDTPETATKAHPAKIKGVTFAGGEDMYKVAEAQIKELKDAKVDYIVCIGHLGIDDETAANANRSIDLLEKVEGIDVFIDGHSHSTEAEIAEKTNEERKVGETYLTSTGTKFANIGVVVIDKDGKITTDCVDTKAITVAEDDAIAARAAEIKAEIEADYGKAFAKSTVNLNGDRAPGNRTEETNLGDLITDAMLWYATKEDLGVPAENVIAITNGGGIRAAIAAGDISKNDVNKVLPFGNTVAVDYVTGEVLLEVLEASTFCTPTAIGGFPQVAGIEFTVDAAKAFDAGENYPGTTYAAPASINRVTITSINGKDFDPEATYAVVTNDFLAAGGDTYYALSVSDRITDTGAPLDEVLMQYITDVLENNVGEKYAEPQGRITIIDPLAAYTDLEDSWYTDAVRTVVGSELMVGTGEGTFDPTGVVTNGQVIQTLYNLTVEEKAEPAKDEAWYAPAVAWAAEQGLVEAEGFEDVEITRAETAKLVADYCALKELTVEGGMAVKEMADYDQVPAEYLEAVGYCFDAGIMVGGEGNLMPVKTLTRVEFAQVLVNLAAFTK
ncbi:bifunctional metallophosphatase/5'-nucleotidase [Vermiculatibacterium agrestimuris]|uniref:bifunctional metallophosphatase/5'-nucleotidase n=1 Tax=Vermiculatibacterium agrestimuris TaxID=2941519 RepID=UPI00203A6C55|nr:5'-nucleotidase C-terminal domain-containing protein [Vermiculatibacterium agrestimuris]